ncbi:RagB/SusD family nutrient uptake outer membrane protein [Chitinophaga filiformis]|uniref:RagB/SusD family nutrient uptake outer membrane protein n=1 Tax=Chitinophaga filiformis TaxID=104663 RepID=UPI001F1FB062|nr:RagB/SusD family nutrient uptake outer membrane protein [Chitinophaga filiformis]MCF6403571.1 RagB/SusD family nutrient uptake outer membrane protein [Chitinophaga filiformis]
MKKALLPILLCSFFACKKEQPDPVSPPPMEDKTTKITVWDATQWSESNPKGIPIEGATVELYATQQDYLIKKPALTATTDKNGIASFKDAKEGEYFIVAFKDQKTNTWADDLGHTKVSDTLFQSFGSINDPQQPIQRNAAPGDFMFRDLNGDAQIDNNDVSAAPFFKVIINNEAPVAASAIIGYPVNHEGAPINTMEEVKAAFAILAQQIGTTHQGFVMLDGVLSDESDGNIIGVESNLAADWQKIDQFQIGSSNAVIRRLWNEHYSSIFKINQLMADISRIAPGETEIRSQLHAFRALTYLDLFRYFGDLPLVEESFMPYDASRSSAGTIEAYIYADVMNSFNNMPVTAPTATPWYATRAAVNMILAKLYIETFYIDGVMHVTDTGWNTYEKLRLSDLSQVFVSPAGTEIIWAISPGLTSPFKEYFVKAGQTVNFFPVTRLTELYLLRALAYVLWHSWGAVGEELNIVANRSGKTVGVISNQDDALRELEKLYSGEFYREGFRYRFLHLTGQAATVLADKGYISYHRHMPIPDSVLMKHPIMTQNVGY